MASIKLKFRASSFQEKEGCLYYQLIHSRTVRQIMTECFIFPSEWDERDEKVKIPTGISEHRLHALQHIERELQWKQEHLRQVIHRLEESGKSFTADDIVNTYEKECSSQLTVFHFFRRHISQLHEVGRHSTASHYAQTLRSLMRFRKDYDLPFDAITPLFSLSYETWLRSRHPYPLPSSPYQARGRYGAATVSQRHARHQPPLEAALRISPPLLTADPLCGPAQLGQHRPGYPYTYPRHQRSYGTRLGGNDTDLPCLHSDIAER